MCTHQWNILRGRINIGSNLSKERDQPNMGKKIRTKYLYY